MLCWTWWTCLRSCPDCCGCWSPAASTGSRSTTTARASSRPATPTTTRSCRPTTATWTRAFATPGRPGKAERAAACSTICGQQGRPRWRPGRRTGSYTRARMGTTPAMRLTSCTASLTRSRTRCGVTRIRWNRRTWPTGWPCAAGNWPRASWSTSPTSLISWAAGPASAPPAPGDDGRPWSPQLPQPGRHRLSQRDPPAVPLKGQLEHRGEQASEAHGHRQQDRGQHEERRRPGSDPAQYQAVRHSDDDRHVRQVEAVGARAEAPRQAAVKETDDRPRARGGDRGEEAANRRSPGQIEPEQVEVRPRGALDHHQRDDRHRGGQRVTGPGPGPGGLAGGDDPGGQQADGEQHREGGGELDQSARLGLPAAQNPAWWPWAKGSCTSKPYTTTDFPLGTGQPGWASTYQVITRLNPSAAQYGGRMRQARRCAYVAIDLNRHPERAGPRPSEKPDSAMNMTTAPRP